MARLSNRSVTAEMVAAAAEPEAAALTGLDNLELPTVSRHPWSARNIWAVVWPKLLAIGLVIGVWELVHLTGWKQFVLPGPATVFANLWEQMQHAQLWQAIDITMRRAVIGFALSVLIGAVIGALVSRIKPLRAATGSLITALQTMPSIAWFPFAIILFGATTNAIIFVIVLGSAPSVANGSLMAGELLVIILGQPSIGALLSAAQDQSDMATAIAIMIVILALGIIIDMLFSKADAVIRRRRGMTDPASA